MRNVIVDTNRISSLKSNKQEKGDFFKNRIYFQFDKDKISQIFAKHSTKKIFRKLI